MFKVTKSVPTLSEHAKLEYVKVSVGVVDSYNMSDASAGNWIHSYENS